MIAHLSASLGEVYRYREVLYNLLARDLKLRYKHTALGYVWSLLNPILQLMRRQSLIDIVGQKGTGDASFE